MPDQFTIDPQQFMKLYVEPLTAAFLKDAEHAREHRIRLEVQLTELKVKLAEIEKRMTTKPELDEINRRLDTLDSDLNKRLSELNTSIDKRLKPIETKYKVEVMVWRIAIPIITGLAVLYFGGFLS